MTVLSVHEGRRNGTLIAEAAKLWIRDEDSVLDLTYGKGNFWTDYRPQKFTTNDLYTEADLHLDYRECSQWFGMEFDVIVFDPPYISTGSRESSTIPAFYEAYGLAGEHERRRGWIAVKTDFALGINTASLLLVGGGRLMVKCCDYVDGGRRRWGHQWVVEAALKSGLEQVDEFIHYSGTGPQPTVNLDGSPRQQVHSRRSHSFLCVFQKPPIKVHSR